MRTLCAACALLLYLTSCDDHDASLPVTGYDVEAVVDAYNYDRGAHALPVGEAFAAIGSVTDAEVARLPDGEEELTFTFEHARYPRTFAFGLERTVDFPEEIDRAKVVFLGHQLIVADMDSDFFVHFFVPDEGNTNLLPELPYVEGYGLGVGASATSLSQELSR